MNHLWNTNQRIVVDKYSHHVIACIGEPNLETGLRALKIKTQKYYLLFILLLCIVHAVNEIVENIKLNNGKCVQWLRSDYDGVVSEYMAQVDRRSIGIFEIGEALCLGGFCLFVKYIYSG